MKLVERHVIRKNHPFWSEIDHKALVVHQQSVGSVSVDGQDNLKALRYKG